jgi:hypothetical protein
MPRVSVLLPTHNRADVLGLAIQSVLDQTEADFELLVVADGCTDGTVALVAAIDDPRIRLYDLPKAPYFGYANRNIALRDARGEYVAFAAHDDLLFPDHLRLLIERLEATGREWIYSRPLWVSTDGAIIPFATNLTIADELEYFLTVANTIPASCVAFRRSCLERNGYWPEDVPSAADWRHWVAIIEGGGRQNHAYLATPTCLHFSANWRQSRYAGVEVMRTWLAIADGAAWWPGALRYPIPTGIPEQHVIAAAMRAGGTVWVDELRAAIDLVLDRVAWDDVRSTRPELRACAVEQAQLRGRLYEVDLALADARQTVERLDAQVAALNAHVAALEAQVTTLDAARGEHDKALAAAGAATADARAAADATRLAGLRAQNELHVTRAQLHAYQERLARTLTSTSWRITAPMRALKDALRRGREHPVDSPDPRT